MKKTIAITEKDIRNIVASAVKQINENRYPLNEGVDDELFQRIKNGLYNFHKELNKAQRTLLTTGMGEDTYFTEIQQLDQSIQNLMNTGILANYQTSF